MITKICEQPKVYWVVGSGTDVGKTTIATALIRYLNAQGHRTVGFKPFAASLLQGIIDFIIEKYPRGGGQSKLYGKDAWKLTEASPLTGPEMIDLVTPTQVLCYPAWHSTVLMRVGSTPLNNVEYLCSSYGARLAGRQDLRHIIDRSGLPFAEAQITEKLSIGYGARTASDKKRMAFSKLLELDVDAVVCEGAGSWLPIWEDCPTVNHLFVITNGMVELFPDINMDFTFVPDKGLREASKLYRSLRQSNVRKFSTPFFLAERAKQEDVAIQIVHRLAARLLEPTLS